MLRLDENVLTRGALAVPALRQAFLDDLAALAQMAEEPGSPDDPRGWLQPEIDRQAQQIAAAVAEDTRFPFSTDRFHATVDYLDQFARIRPPYVQCQLGNFSADSTMPQQDCSALLPH